MWTRAELKDRAKTVLNRNYGKMLVISLVSMFAGWGAIGFNFSVPTRSDLEEFRRMGENGGHNNDVLTLMIGIFTVMLAFGLVISLIQIAIVIFLSNPLRVSINRFMLCARVRDNASLSELGYGFKYSYGNIVKVMFLKSLYEFLWGLLFVIPGIIKSYEYYMIPYLLAENPDLTAEEAFAQSKQMMDGEKWKTFVLGLSFIGWIFLSMCTCYLVIFFFVLPYMLLTYTELYAVLKQKLYGPYQGYGQMAYQGFGNPGYGNQGYNNSGYDQGYNQGFENPGYNNQGNNSNYNPYYNQEYNPGYNQNYNQGYNQNYTQNYNQGYNQNNNQNYGQNPGQNGNQDNGPKQ